MPSCKVQSVLLCGFDAVKLLMSGYSAIYLTRYITQATKPLESIMCSCNTNGLVSTSRGTTRMGGAPLTFRPLSQTPLESLTRLPLTSMLCRSSSISIINRHILLCRFDYCFVRLPIFHHGTRFCLPVQWCFGENPICMRMRKHGSFC